MSNIVIDIAAEFTGKKAFKQADTATGKLVKSAGKLAASLGVAFSTRAIVNYSKAAALAAAQDQQAQAVLAVNLKNLGLAYANVDSERFIALLEKQTGILDDELRPAYAQLARTTMSIKKTQDLMTVAFDASKGSTLSYATTVDILSKAYVGNKKGLKQLDLGLSAAELAAMSFDEILQAITKHFAGAGLESMKGYRGQMDKLNVSTANLQENIGGALLDSFSKLAGGGDIDKATSKIDTFGESVAGVIRLMTGVNSLSAAFNNVNMKFGIIPVTKKTTPLNAFAQSPADRAAIEAANRKAADKAKADAAAAAKLAKISADQLKLAKAKATLDLQQIQIVAALKGKISEEDRIALKLQLALLNENATEATKLSEQLTAAKEKNATLATTIAALPKATNPFAEWPTFIQTAIAGLQDGSLTVLEKISAAAQATIALTNTVAQQSIQAGIAAGNSLAAALSGARYAAQGDAAAQATAIASAAATAAAANAALLAGNKATLDAIAKANAEALAKAQADAAASNTKIISDAAATAAQIAADAIDAQATSKAALEKLIAEQNAALATAATNAATAAASIGASSAAANAAQVAADAADAAGIAYNNNASTVITVNVGGTVISETDLATVILDTINNAGVAGTQTIINNASLATAG